MKKYWETGEKNDFGKECYKLHFSQFYEEDDEKYVVKKLKKAERKELSELLIKPITLHLQAKVIM